ncbi:MAG TPA: 2Fe-2S iron-sulfur cluster-binding protein [Verrucomicrobiae bacterium]|nr:2Fe-2S iron-sulfur cluster-binding protein [Verrucomicrobiae bacterium]
MNESTPIQITIDGRPVQAKVGQTVYEAAATAGIYIPALCYHPQLKPAGACRICLVEIDKQRSLQPSCTFPVMEGMVVRTDTPAVVASRKASLHMIFSERTHYCMFCPASGTGETTDCELQKLGYEYGLNCWDYAPNYGKQWPIDASRKYFVMDHGRCILCRRCVRACEEIAANHTLGLHQRGARAMIGADDDVPFGESTCVSCGTCLQVCPTGALHDRHSVYLGHESQIKRTPATCVGCAVGCGIQAITRGNHLLRVEGDWGAPNGGLLCAAGRFEVVEPKPTRILQPLVRRNGQFVEKSWDDTLALIGTKFSRAHLVAGLVSPRLTSESLAAFECFFHDVLESSEIGLLSGEVPPLDLGTMASLRDVADADYIAIIGGNPLHNQKVLGHLIRRALDNGAHLLMVNDETTGIDDWAELHLELEDISFHAASPFERLKTTYHLRVSGLLQLKKAIEPARHPVLLYGSGLSSSVYAALRTLPAQARFLPLVKGANAVGAARLGLEARPVRGDALYVLVGDDLSDGPPLPQSEFTVVHASVRSAWTDTADVILPSPTWAEQRGHIINLEGRRLPVVPLLLPPASVPPHGQVFVKLAERMGETLPPEALVQLAGPE